MTELLVNIDVDDLQRGIDFYCAAFGLRVGRRFGDGAVELLGAKAPIYLLVKAAGSPPHVGAERGRSYARHWTPVHLDFVVEDVEAATAQVEAAGGKREGEVVAAAWGKMVQLADPFGNGLCLIQFVAKGYDEIATGRGGD